MNRARSELERLAKRTDGLEKWMGRMQAPKNRRVIVLALAVCLARIAWALLTSGERFTVQRQPAS